MEKDDNLHAGHRKRTINRFLEYPESFCDHEVLEAILFYALPRIDTNPIAHRLIKTFGSLKNVVMASPSELKAVQGVGDSAAVLLNMFGRVSKIIEKSGKKKINLSTPEKVMAFAEEKLAGLKQEKFLLLFMNDKRDLLTVLEFSDKKASDVQMEIPELTQALLVHRPAYAIIAHNHPSGDPTPSYEDDIATKKIYLLCSINGTTLVDHVIYANGNFYGYRSNYRMEHVKSQADVDTFLNVLKEK